MRSVVAKIIIFAYFPAGLWIFVAHKLDTYPLPTIFVLLALWLGLGAVLAVIAYIFQMHNPFDRMNAADRMHIAALVDAQLSKRPLQPQDKDSLLEVFEKYAPDLSPSAQFAAFAEFVKNHGQDLIAGMPRLEKPSRDGACLILSRQKRRPGFDVTRQGTIWFGGLPALSDQTWPRDPAGVLLTPLVQIDLSEVSALIDVPGVPKSGSLAFFASFPEKGGCSSAVRYVTSPTPLITQPDGPLTPIGNQSVGGPLRRGEAREGQLLYPRMAMELTVSDLSKSHTEQTRPQVLEEALGSPPEYCLSAGAFPDCMPPKQEPFNRDSVLRFVYCAELSLAESNGVKDGLVQKKAKFEADIASKSALLHQSPAATNSDEADVEAQDKIRQHIQSLQAAISRLTSMLSGFADELRKLAAGISLIRNWANLGDRWAALTRAELAEISQSLQPWIEEGHLGRLLLQKRYKRHSNMSDCVNETLHVMAVADDSIFAKLPVAVRDAINGPYRQPLVPVCHQMFGQPACIQGDPEDHDDAHLLLQMQCDTIAGFHWGDAGHLQFWIRPKDLREGHWDKAFMTSDSY